MIISFDIDNTLIPYSTEFEVFQKNWLSRIMGAESLRVGTRSLFKELEKRGHEIWIYTTSTRSIFSLKITFYSQGLYPKRIINDRINRMALKRNNCSSSKNPALFGIDLHVDDAPGVQKEGENYGFKTILVATSDRDWVQSVLSKM